MQGERTALNILSRSSGIATATKAVVDLAQEKGWQGECASTRKVTPGFRLIEKYSVLVGGGSTHRMDLSHMVMLKDNHIWSTGSITAAVKKARQACGFSSKIEVETDSYDGAAEAATAGAEIVMLDNMEPAVLKETAQKLKAAFPALTIEASGGITIATIADFFSPSVDVISQSFSSGYGILDYSLKIQPGLEKA
jgi:nicotinate-nucleotide pyrophosphorylase (carboxylating)